MCGEKYTELDLSGLEEGSPPRVRGKAIVSFFVFIVVRITPACEDHPRVCGEKYTELDLSGLEEGSPPRVRGKAIVSFFVFIVVRITPACAGKRAVAKMGMSDNQDHPRVCGEKTPKSE